MNYWTISTSLGFFSYIISGWRVDCGRRVVVVLFGMCWIRRDNDQDTACGCGRSFSFGQRLWWPILDSVVVAVMQLRIVLLQSRVIWLVDNVVWGHSRSSQAQFRPVFRGENYGFAIFRQFQGSWWRFPSPLGVCTDCVWKDNVKL